jgi:hypothetical protein
MSSTYDKNVMFEATGMHILGGILYICDTGNSRISRLGLAANIMIDSYDLTIDDRPLAILVYGTRCYVLINHLTDPNTARIDLLIYNLSSPVTAPMTLWKTVTVSSSGIVGGPNPPQVGGLFLQYAGGFITAACFTSIKSLVKLDLDGNIISTTTLPAGDPLYGMAVG